MPLVTNALALLLVGPASVTGAVSISTGRVNRHTHGALTGN